MLATVADVHAKSWTRSEQLLATVADRLGDVTYLLELHLAVRGTRLKNPGAAAKKVQPPEPLQRPGIEKPRRRGTSVAELLRMKGGGDG